MLCSEEVLWVLRTQGQWPPSSGSDSGSEGAPGIGVLWGRELLLLGVHMAGKRLCSISFLKCSLQRV